MKKTLKSVDLTTDISMWCTKTDAGNQLFVILDLTDKGDKGNAKVLHASFAFFNAAKAAGADEKLYKSIQDYVKVELDWQEKGISGRFQ